MLSRADLLGTLATTNIATVLSDTQFTSLVSAALSAFTAYLAYKIRRDAQDVKGKIGADRRRDDGTGGTEGTGSGDVSP